VSELTNLPSNALSEIERERERERGCSNIMVVGWFSGLSFVVASFELCV
jgi:hypothetical protein